MRKPQEHGPFYGPRNKNGTHAREISLSSTLNPKLRLFINPGEEGLDISFSEVVS